MKQKNRDAAIQIDIIDPDYPNSHAQITQLISLGDIFLIITEKGIYKAFFPEDIDPQGKDLRTKSTYTKLYSIGSSSPYVTRAFIQIKSIMDFSKYKSQLLPLLWEAVQHLLECENCAFYIYNETFTRAKKAEKTINESKDKSFIPLLPTVPSLKENVSQFLIGAKHFLINTFKVMNIIFGTPFFDSNFSKYHKWAEERRDKYDDIYQLISEDISWIKTLTNLRNALEHPQKGQSLSIKNITPCPGNKFTSPAWKYDLSLKDCPVQEYYSDMIRDIDVFLNNLLTFHEDLWALCLNHELQQNYKFLQITKEIHTGDTRKYPTIFRIEKKA